MCLKITPSKLWDHDANRGGFHTIDARRWYCPWCNKRYEAKWGQIVIISRWDEDTGNYEHYYMRAKVPTWATEDVRAQFLEAEHPDCQTPEDLYDRLKTREPAPTALVVEEHNPVHAEWRPEHMTPHLQRCKESNLKFVNRKTFYAMKSMDWNQVFNWAGEEPPIQTESNKGWKKLLAERLERNEQLKRVGVVRGPTEVENKRGDGLEAHSMETIVEAAKKGIQYSCENVSSEPGLASSPTVQGAAPPPLEPPPGLLLPTTAVPLLSGSPPPVAQQPPPPPGPPPKQGSLCTTCRGLG